MQETLKGFGEEKLGLGQKMFRMTLGHSPLGQLYTFLLLQQK
jgi:hypothetical protein